MDSFYGGKQGISFVIKDKFESVGDMEWCFSYGYYRKLENDQWINDEERPYTNSVWYGEYCIIDTPNKNNIENGRVYRRTANHTPKVGSNDTNHAEYVGQIVGPAGGIPGLELKSLEELDSDFDSLGTPISTGAETPISSGGKVYYKNNIENKYTQVYPTITTPSLQLAKEIDNNSVIYKSGKDYYDKGITPAFKYGFYTFQGVEKDDSSDTFPISTIGLGFEIPYVDFSINPTITALPFNATGSITVTAPDESNKFYKEYSFSMPQGAPGAFITNLRTITNVTSTSPIFYDLTKIDYVNHSITPGDTITPVSSTVICGESFYYQDSDTVTYISDPNNSASPAKFLISNQRDIKETNLNVTLTDSSFGDFRINYTDGSIYRNTIPLLKGLRTESEGGTYKLYAQYAGQTEETYIGNTSLPHWGICGIEITSTSAYSEWPYEPTPTAGEGNLGFTPAPNGEGNVTFYYWNEVVSPSQWQQIGSIAQSKTNIDIITVSDSQFNVNSTSYPVVFAAIEEPSITPSIESFSDAPWR